MSTQSKPSNLLLQSPDLTGSPRPAFAKREHTYVAYRTVPEKTLRTATKARLGPTVPTLACQIVSATPAPRRSSNRF